MKVTQMPPVHAANLVANSGNTAYGVDIIPSQTDAFSEGTVILHDEITGIVLYSLKKIKGFSRCRFVHWN